jgi:hypothetical protein
MKAGLNEHRIGVFTDFVDSGVGVCIAVVYTLYFSVVKGTLVVFNCVPNEQGVRVMAAFPSELCDSVCTAQWQCTCRFTGSHIKARYHVDLTRPWAAVA